MRILHINCNYLGSTLHQLMIRELESLGIENDVFVPTYDQNNRVINPDENVCVMECFNKSDRVIFDYKQKKILNAIESKFDIKKYDLIHAYTLFTDGNCARVLSEKYGVPFVVAVRNTDVNDFLKKMIHLRGRAIKTLKAAKQIFFLSQAYRKQVFDKYVSDKEKSALGEKVKIIPNGIDSFWFKNSKYEEKKIDNKNIKLVYAGGIDRNKNITTTQKAMRVLQDAGFHATLTVVGKIVDSGEYKRIIDNSMTTYLPAMPKEELINIYRANDIFVMPSIHESFGLVYAEAMTQGLPLIYSRGQGFDGQFPEGVIGYGVDSLSPKDIAEKIKMICENYNSISSNTNTMSRKFTWNTIVREYFEVYKQIVNRN